MADPFFAPPACGRLLCSNPSKQLTDAYVTSYGTVEDQALHRKLGLCSTRLANEHLFGALHPLASFITAAR